YRLIRSYFAKTKYWHQHDPFLEQKNQTFRSSSAAVHKLAQSLLELDSQKEKLSNDEDALKTLFGEILHMCLWGNATDLSLLTNMTHSDIQKLQTVSRDEQAERAQYILLDNGEMAWDQLQKSRNRVDMVLDNAGFEVTVFDISSSQFVTILTALHGSHFCRVPSFAIRCSESGLPVSPVRVCNLDLTPTSPKALPWFVSDVTPPDFSQTISILQNANEWSSGDESEDARSALGKVASRFQERMTNGIFELSVPLSTKLGEPVPGSGYEFWTSPSAYYYMQDEAPDLLHTLSKSSLVIFKGDLNYRKLTGDIKWPVSTPFCEALGPLRGAFPILSLRTNKADVAVGVSEEVAKKLDEQEVAWRTSGQYALISFDAKA
ncbi:hypothetical protein FRC18_007625, partial [Serendipita sp. 400]